MGFPQPRPPETSNLYISPMLFSRPQSPMGHNSTNSIDQPPTVICAILFRKSQVKKVMIHLPQPTSQPSRHRQHLRTTQHRRREWFSIQ
ncbi:hypothetical protein BVRB_8g190800 isoform B [Beta vulgaris subsp. vulgaris]|nr:hypothetical protein BVRB_8g190800 isoform B [Beta vulgaris subsp. vulgaris]